MIFCTCSFILDKLCNHSSVSEIRLEISSPFATSGNHSCQSEIKWKYGQYFTLANSSAGSQEFGEDSACVPTDYQRATGWFEIYLLRYD